jgi:hypothetical protein
MLHRQCVLSIGLPDFLGVYDSKTPCLVKTSEGTTDYRHEIMPNVKVYSRQFKEFFC